MASTNVRQLGQLAGRAVLVTLGLSAPVRAIEAAEVSRPLIEIVPLRPSETPRLRIDTLVTSKRIERVDFLVDGRLLSSDRRFPFSARIESEALSTAQLLEAVAYDREGSEVARDRLRLGSTTTDLAITISRIQEVGRSGWLEIATEVVPPASSSIERVDFYRDQHFAASKRQRPFQVRIPGGSGSHYLRVVAHLRDGAFAEEVRLLDTESLAETVAVNLVEIYAMVSDRRGRPVTTLDRSDFALWSGDFPLHLERFAIGDDVPLSVALVLDSSDSMLTSMGEAKRAARLFLEQALDVDDRALLVDFDTRPHLLQDSTEDIAALLSRFEAIGSRGGSAVYDAIVFGLLQLERSAGRKALVVVTDGLDSGSRSTVEDCTRLARRIGVPIFIVAMGDQLEERPSHRSVALRRLAEATGGRVYRGSGEPSLIAAYREIDLQLRGQYLLGFTAPRALTGVELDALQLSVSDETLRVRTILGGQLSLMD